MKTREESNLDTTKINPIEPKITPIATLPSRSVRPQRSMMRIQSLKPKRIEIATSKAKK